MHSPIHQARGATPRYTPRNKYSRIATYVKEENLISPALPIMSVYHVQGGGRVTRVHCCSFPQDIQTFVTELLPRDDSV